MSDQPEPEDQKLRDPAPWEEAGTPLDQPADQASLVTFSHFASEEEIRALASAHYDFVTNYLHDMLPPPMP